MLEVDGFAASRRNPSVDSENRPQADDKQDRRWAADCNGAREFRNLAGVLGGWFRLCARVVVPFAHVHSADAVPSVNEKGTKTSDAADEPRSTLRGVIR